MDQKPASDRKWKDYSSKSTMPAGAVCLGTGSDEDKYLYPSTMPSAAECLEPEVTNTYPSKSIRAFLRWMPGTGSNEDISEQVHPCLQSLNAWNRKWRIHIRASPSMPSVTECLEPEVTKINISEQVQPCLQALNARDRKWRRPILASPTVPPGAKCLEQK
jgi:hypothetical protein